MKKIAVAALATTILMTGSAFAAEFPNSDLSGDLKVHYRWNGGTGNSTEGGKIFFRLNAESEISQNVSVFARLAIQQLGGPDNTGNDFDSAYYGDRASSIDRWGLNIKSGNFKYTLGRQGVTLANGLLFDSTGYMGKTTGSGDFTASAIDGLVVSGKSGVTSLQMVAGEAWTDLEKSPKLYAVSASYSPAKDWTLGGTFAKSKLESLNTNYWAASIGYTAGKASFSGDYGKSNADADNTAYALGAFYNIDSKNSVYAIYSKVEQAADIGDWMTAYDDGYKGMYYGFDRKLRKDTTLSFFYKDMDLIGGTSNNTSLRTTVTYKF